MSTFPLFCLQVAVYYHVLTNGETAALTSRSGQKGLPVLRLECPGKTSPREYELSLNLPAGLTIYSEERKGLPVLRLEPPGNVSRVGPTAQEWRPAIQLKYHVPDKKWRMGLSVRGLQPGALLVIDSECKVQVDSSLPSLMLFGNGLLACKLTRTLAKG